MGGIYPSNVLIGNVSNINIIDDIYTSFDLKLVSDPLKGNYLGVIENL